MLINTNNLGVCFLKLINGDEIIGTSTYDASETKYTINKPFKIAVVPTQQGMQISLIPWINSVLPTADATYPIPANLVITSGPCDPELSKSYKEQVTGIALG